ncbi:autotransporter outer membrane beta-barrel domain-containing protein [Litoreibacter arenae]|uniref:Autotransporter domain-containing protein n=1 Tax=Litoreibacter arenae DSM 19593 TaxID=1123360 RepID=S9QKM0_9RHOB|nr:autotransporter outer membrane beta-barrel domain-containing protein [Litoreibacter arenae]EPX80103.1 hypothetical protein thalar_01440 [Litoreibacter arenae DSM 19593]
MTLVSLLRTIAFSTLAMLALAQLASAQTRPNEPEGELNAGIGSITGNNLASYRDAISSFRNAIAQRRSSTTRLSFVAQDDTTLSGGTAPVWGGLSSIWGSLDTKRMNGTYSGTSGNLIFGVDALVGSSTIVGLLAGYNRSNVDLPSGQRVKAKGVAVGPYFSTQLSDRLSLDGFIGFARPDYTVDGGQFEGDKTFGNLTLTGSVPLRSAELSPFISIASSREDLPAFTSVAPVVAYAPTEIKSFVATIGTGINYNPIDRGNLTYLPTAGFEIDYVRNDDGFGNIDSFTTPRISGGVTILSDVGALNLGANVSRTSEGTTTVGASAAYFWQF